MNGNYQLQDYLTGACRQHPDNVAIKYGGKTITYKQLLMFSTAVAENLAKLGMRKGEFVCLYTGKSETAVSAIFGVLIAGGAYIPMDTVASPVERCCDILKKSEARFLITTQEKLGKLLANKRFGNEYAGKIKILVLDEYQDAIQNISEMQWNLVMSEEEQEKRRGTDQDIAYILFTSGSTGKPKGVMLSHLNGRTFIEWCMQEFKPVQEDRFISIAPFHFDLSVFDLYVPVASGASLCIMPEADEKNPLKTMEYVKKEKITYLYSVPSLWSTYLRYGKDGKEGFPYLKKILYAGESFPISYLRQLYELVRGCEIYNLYGLIETNVFTYYKVREEDCKKEEIPIGYACANSEAVVLKEDLQVASQGEEGELCVRGSCVMKGYYGEEEQTRKSFVKSPVPVHHGEMLFRTGDIVRIDENGAFVFLGRNDQMIKKNGFRIELKEIESVLDSNPNVREAVAVGIKDGNGQVYVGVYAVVEENKMTVTELKHFIAERLPKYMVPDFCLFGENLPHNSNGKADRVKIATLFEKF